MTDADLIERLRMEAQIHAQEARTANATIAEIYQLCSGGKGEPGNWHGAEPVRELVRELQGLRAARVAYASEFPANEDGEPDVGSIHQNIRRLKAEAVTLRQQAGSAVSPQMEDARACTPTMQSQQAGRVDEATVEHACRGFYGERWLRMDEKESPRHWMRAALTAALAQNTQGDGEPVAWARPQEVVHLAKQNGVANVPMWNCSGDGRVPLYLHAERAMVPEAKTEMDYEYDEEGLLDPYSTGHMDGWNDCLKALSAAPSQPKDAGEVGRGVALIAAERARQINAEGWSPAHDAEHTDGELACAAACYAVPPGYKLRERTPPFLWPWEESWWKPGDRVRELTKAGALIAAEIDRLATTQPEDAE